MILAYMTTFDYASGWLGFILVIAALVATVLFIALVANMCMEGAKRLTGNGDTKRHSVEHDVDDMVLHDFVQDSPDHQIGKW